MFWLKKNQKKKKKKAKNIISVFLNGSFMLNGASQNVSKRLINSSSEAIVLSLANHSMYFFPASWKISYSHSFN